MTQKMSIENSQIAFAKIWKFIQIYSKWNVILKQIKAYHITMWKWHHIMKIRFTLCHIRNVVINSNIICE